jgi:hypothetical protein
MGMRRRSVGVVALIFFLAVCSAATTVLVFVSPQEAVVAADSLSNPLGGSQRPVCKISQASAHMLFAASGVGTTPLLNPYDLARVSAGGGRSPHDAAMEYAADAWYPLETFWRASRALYLQIMPAGLPRPRGPQGFVFVGLDRSGLITGSGGGFVEMSVAVPVLRRAIEPVEFGEVGSSFLYRLGIVENLPSDAEINRWILESGAPAALKRAIEIQSGATPTLVGGRVSVVRLGRDGSIRWIDRGECP